LGIAYLLEAVNLAKRYWNGKMEIWALKDLNLKVKRGEFLAIVGPSGAGKSTLLHLLGLLDSPTEGELFWKGERVESLSLPQRAHIRNRAIGFIFQFYHLLPEFSALENVMLPARIGGERKEESRKRAEELLKELGLGQRLTHRPAELSGGEQQRVAIARALINNPEVLLCDEPTGNLDSRTGREIISILKKLNRVEGKTLVIVSHQEEIVKEADRILQMRDGRIVR